MALFDSLFKRSNPTRTWIANEAVPLVLDLDNHKLSGVGIGDSYEHLSFLGPGQSKRGEFVCYPDKGIEIDNDDGGRISGISIFFGHAEEPQRARFPGDARYRGTSFILDSRTNEKSIRERLGEPYHRDEDEDEVILFYEWPNCEWQIELGSDGGLKCWSIAGEPLMADPKQRESYGVKKPWPPS
jgi:hypothetical protein